MRKFLLSVLLLPVLASAEPVTVDKPVVCDDTNIVLNGLGGEKYKEVAVWAGEGKSSMFAVLVNPTSTTWSIIQFNQEKACVLGTGFGFKFRLPDK